MFHLSWLLIRDDSDLNNQGYFLHEDQVVSSTYFSHIFKFDFHEILNILSKILSMPFINVPYKKNIASLRNLR